MFNYHMLPSHIKWLYNSLRLECPEGLTEFYPAIWDIARNLPDQAYDLDILEMDYEPLYELIKDEPIFAELARELEIEMDSE